MMNPLDKITEHKPESGYTLIELILVVIILTLALASVAPNLSDLSPKHAIRGAAREVGTTVNWVKSLSISSGKTFHLNYDIDNSTYHLIRPPAEDDPPDLPIDQRMAMAKSKLPNSVMISKVIFPNGDVIDSGEIDIAFDLLGHEGSHIVVFENSTYVDGQKRVANKSHTVSVKFSSILGIVDYFPGEVDFESFE